MQTLWEIRCFRLVMNSHPSPILYLWRAEYSNASTTISHLTTSAQVNRKLFKNKFSPKIKAAFLSFLCLFFSWLLLLMVWDWNTSLTFPISLPHYKSISALLGVSTASLNILFPITPPEPTHPTSVVWGLIHQHQLVLWTSFWGLKSLMPGPLGSVILHIEDELIFCYTSFWSFQNLWGSV